MDFKSLNGFENILELGEIWTKSHLYWWDWKKEKRFGWDFVLNQSSPDPFDLKFQSILQSPII